MMRSRPSRVARRWTAGADVDDGFSLVETLVGMTLLAVIVVISINGIGRAFATLGDAKDVDVATGVAQGRIESIRSLDFADVGTTTGSPSGVVVANETVVVQGVEIDVTTTIEWVGSASGLAVVPGGGDGVPGFFDPGLDYKLVTVTATALGGNPVRFETIVSPPNVTAAEGSANAIVDLVADQPPGAPAPTDFPTVYLHHELGLYVGSINTQSPLFADIDPDTEHQIRLGADLGDFVSGDGDWAMIDPDLDVTVGAAQTLTTTATVYRPITLEVTGLDHLGAPLTAATLVVTNDATAEQVTLTEVDMSGAGTWSVTEMSGTPLRWGSYSYTLSSPGHDTGTASVTDAPISYPADLTDETTIQLAEAIATSTMIVAAGDSYGRRLHGVSVSVTDPGGTQVVTSDVDGLAQFELEHGVLHDLQITSPYGHTTYELTGVDPAVYDAGGSFIIVATLETPADSALFILEHDTGTAFGGQFQYQRTTSNPDDWQDALANADGEVSVVVVQHTEDIYSRWEARVHCPVSGDTGNKLRRRFSPLKDRTRSFPESC